MTESLRLRASRAAGWQAAQHGAVQAIYFVRLLVLARLLAPDAFGLLAIATVAISVLVRISDPGMIQALVQRSEAADEQYDAAWTVNVLRGVAVTACLVFTGPAFAGLFGEPAAGPIVSVLSLRVAIGAFASIDVARLTRDLQFRQLAKMRVPPALLDTALAILLAPRLGVWALVAGGLAGASASTVLSWVVAPRRFRFRLHAGDLAPLVRFGRWVMLIGVLSLAGNSLSQAAISRLLGAASLGVYFLAVRVAFLPADAVGSVVGPVAFPVFAVQPDAERAADAFRRLLIVQAALVWPACALVVVLAPGLEALLGGRWQGTAPVIQVLALASAAGVYREAVVPALMGLGRPQRVALIEAIHTAVWLLALLPLIHWAGVTGAAIAWLSASLLAQGASSSVIRPLLPTASAGLRSRLVPMAIVAAAGGALAWSITAVVPGFGGLVLGACAAMLAMAIALLRLDRTRDLGLERLLPRPLPGRAGWTKGGTR